MWAAISMANNVKQPPHAAMNSVSSISLTNKYYVSSDLKAKVASSTSGTLTALILSNYFSQRSDPLCYGKSFVEAIDSNNMKVFERLINCGVGVNFNFPLPPPGGLALFVAIKKFHTPLVGILLSNKPLDVSWLIPLGICFSIMQRPIRLI